MSGRKKVIWDNHLLIGEVQKSDATKLRIELVARDGVKIINIREWYKKKSDNEWKTYGKGFGIPVMVPINGERQTPAMELASLIEQAMLKAPDFEIEDPENTVWG